MRGDAWRDVILFATYFCDAHAVFLLSPIPREQLAHDVEVVVRRRELAGREPSDVTPRRVGAGLEEAEHHVDVALGARRVSDLVFIDDDDLDALGMTPEERAAIRIHVAC